MKLKKSVDVKCSWWTMFIPRWHQFSPWNHVQKMVQSPMVLTQWFDPQIFKIWSFEDLPRRSSASMSWRASSSKLSGAARISRGIFSTAKFIPIGFQRQKSGFLPNQFTVINWFLRKENQQSHLLIYRSELRLSGFSPRPRMKVVSRWNWRHRTEDLIHDGFWVNIRPEVS